MAKGNVLLYVPNIICYVRLLIQIYALAFIVEEPTKFLLYTFISCMLLFCFMCCLAIQIDFFFCFISKGCFDFFDGIAARKLNQTSKFGAILDVLIDNFSRSALWVGVLIHNKDKNFIVLFCCVYYPMEEWFTQMVVQLMTVDSKDKHWKSINNYEKYPKWVKIVLADGFKNIYAVFVIGSGWTLPFWWIVYELGYKYWWIQATIWISVPSRLYNTAICLYLQAKYMLNVDKVVDQ